VTTPAVLALALLGCSTSASPLRDGIRAAARGRPPAGGLVLVFHEERPGEREAMVELDGRGRGRAELKVLDRCGNPGDLGCWTRSERPLALAPAELKRLLDEVARLPLAPGDVGATPAPGAPHAELQVRVGAELGSLSASQVAAPDQASWASTTAQLLRLASGSAAPDGGSR
jgi:hypothetical protein